MLCWPHRRVETALGEGFYFLRIFYTTTLISVWMSNKNFDVTCYILCQVYIVHRFFAESISRVKQWKVEMAVGGGQLPFSK